MALKAKKGDKVIFHMFTGCATGIREVTAANKESITIATAKGDMTFNRKTGKQIDPEPREERYANFITEDDGSFVPPTRRKAAKPEKASKKKKPEPEPEEDEDDDIDEDDFEEADEEDEDDED